MNTGIIVAAGKGIRMNQKARKQYLLMKGLPIISHTLKTFDSCEIIDDILLVIPEQDFDFCRTHILPSAEVNKRIELVAGGPERQDSVYNGLSAVTDPHGIAVIHDGVRPFVNVDVLAACVKTAAIKGACILGMPVSETVKRVNSEGYIEKTLDRNPLWTAQTPQAFQYTIIKKAHDKARVDGIRGTDDALLVERLGHKVDIIEGSRFNIKITTPEDLQLADAIYQILQSK